MKTTIYTIALLVLIYGCNEAASNSEITHREDSLQYYPPTPKQLDKQEFRQYRRVLTSFFDSLLVKRGFNGSILVAKDGAIVYEKYAGFADLRNKRFVDKFHSIAYCFYRQDFYRYGPVAPGAGK